MSEQATLQLDQPRAIAIRDKGKTFTYTFRRITAGDWKKYYRGIVSQTETVDGGQVRSFDFRTALQMLVEETLQSVEGYRTADGAPLAQKPDWKARLPISHKIAAGLVLGDVTVDREAADDVDLISDLNEVSLTCKWTSESCEASKLRSSGAMTQLSGLLHRFRHPTIEQLRKFNRESSRARVVGGSRTGKTIWPGSQELLADLYDQLIESVDGYLFGGEPLDGQVESIKNQMDTHHKVRAVEALFAATEDSEAQVPKEEEEAS